MIGRLIAALLLLTGAAAASAPEAKPSGGIAIVGANVLPMTEQERLADQTVLIVGDRIVKVGPRAKVKVPAGYKRIEGRGRTLMPGLVDMHIHLSPEQGKPGDATHRALAVMLAHGVTTARTMAGHPIHPSVREKIERGELQGPRLYAAAPALHEQNTPSVEAARRAVAAAKEAGFDLVKSHHLPNLEVWQAVQDEARRQGLPTAGHVPNSVGLERAMAAKQQIEHLDSVFFALLPPGTPGDFGQIPPPPVLDAAAAATDAQYRALARKAAGSWHVPTLSLFERIADVSTPTEELTRSSDMRFVPDATIAQWAEQRRQFAASGFTAEHGTKCVDVRRRMVRAFHAAGVPLMAGSDTAQRFHIWGPGLHREIEALSAAGLGPMAALRSATVVPRDYFRSLPNGGSALGWKAHFGTVEAGARADLILLAADPSKDLKALHVPEAVIAGGRLFERRALDTMLALAAEGAKAVKAPAAAAAPGGPAIVYVIRHLQKGADGQDPGLTEEGRRNAERLATLLAKERPSAIYVSATRRAQETAAPLAARLGIVPKVYDPRDAAALVERVKAEAGVVLVVGHSNTVPDIVERFGGARPAPLTDSDYGDVWRVRPKDGATEQIGLGGG